ncbi:MAG: glycolate oxidase iron-sulfur subunit [Planctomycetota bacterium]|jgi:glycolate oxidase iron-sulfur subunit
MSESNTAPGNGAAMDLAGLVDHAKTLDCIHCGLCLQSCPTYQLSGAEPSSPRGRIHMMRSIGEGAMTPDAGYAEELDFCLLCRHCESVCPAGVQFGSMMETARDAVERVVKRPLLTRLLRHIGFRHVLPNRLILRVLGSALRVMQLLRLDSLAAKIGGARGAGVADLPRIQALGKRRLLPKVTPATGTRTESVAVLEGCVMPEMFPGVNRSTVDSLAKLGLESHRLPGVVCCGSLHAHNGDLKGARDLARVMLDGYDQLSVDLNAAPRIAINSAGCGAHMRELGHLFAEGDPDHLRAKMFASHVVDYSEVVAPLLADRAPIQDDALGDLPGPLTWDDPCHLCHAQGVRVEPRQVLEKLPVALVPLQNSESCCGSAGIYSLLRPSDSADVFAPKLESFQASGAKTLVTANPGCQMQWQAGLRRSGSSARVVHLAELVDRALP